MASLGDSITRAFNTGGLPFTDAPGNSLSTGTRSSVDSHYSRILAVEPAILDRNFNDAVSGAKMADLDTQVGTVDEQTSLTSRSCSARTISAPGPSER